MYSILLDIFWVIILLDILIFVVMVVFLLNARINLHRHITNTRFFFNALNASKTSETSAEAAEMANMDIDEYIKYCKTKGIITPEVRKEKIEKIEKEKLKHEQKILEEEVTWRAEQEKILEERRKAQETEAQKRKDRLKQFGFR